MGVREGEEAREGGGGPQEADRPRAEARVAERREGDEKVARVLHRVYQQRPLLPLLPLVARLAQLHRVAHQVQRHRIQPVPELNQN